MNITVCISMRLWSKIVYHMRMSHTSKFGLSMAFYRSQGKTQKRVFKSRSRPFKWWWWCCFFFLHTCTLLLDWTVFISSLVWGSKYQEFKGEPQHSWDILKSDVQLKTRSLYILLPNTPNRILVQSGDFGLTMRAGAWPAGTASTASGKDFLLHRNSVPTQTSSFFKFAQPISSVIISYHQ